MIPQASKAALLQVTRDVVRSAFDKPQRALALTYVHGLKDASVLSRQLLEGGHSVVAGRLAGALRACGRDVIAAFPPAPGLPTAPGIASSSRPA